MLVLVLDAIMEVAWLQTHEVAKTGKKFFSKKYFRLKCFISPKQIKLCENIFVLAKLTRPQKTPHCNYCNIPSSRLKNTTSEPPERSHKPVVKIISQPCNFHSYLSICTRFSSPLFHPIRDKMLVLILSTLHSQSHCAVNAQYIQHHKVQGFVTCCTLSFPRVGHGNNLPGHHAPLLL